MVNKIVYIQWLDKADTDYKFATRNLEENDQFFDQICFHYQQAGEKYLKAYIVANKLLFIKTHDLVRLNKICQKKDSPFSVLEIEAKYLTDFYIESRYPSDWSVGQTKEDAEKAKEAAKKIGDFVKKKLLEKK